MSLCALCVRGINVCTADDNWHHVLHSVLKCLKNLSGAPCVTFRVTFLSLSWVKGWVSFVWCFSSVLRLRFSLSQLCTVTMVTFHSYPVHSSWWRNKSYLFGSNQSKFCPSPNEGSNQTPNKGQNQLLTLRCVPVQVNKAWMSFPPPFPPCQTTCCPLCHIHVDYFSASFAGSVTTHLHLSSSFVCNLWLNISFVPPGWRT